jgi:hypothetical protein
LINSGDKLTTHNMASWQHLPQKGFPIIFHAVDGENLREGNSPSWFNPQEAEQAVNYVQQLVNSKPPVDPLDIGVITPYARQAQKIRLALQSRNIINVKVGSVETFQGQERRCIVISTVRVESDHLSTDKKYNLGFVANEKRFNVAVTRAKALLIVVGCPTLLANDKQHWLPFMRYCKEMGSWAGEPWEDTTGDRGDSDSGPHNCCICLSEPEPQELAVINGCDHFFCYSCIERWETEHSTCPLCKESFTIINRVALHADDGEDDWDLVGPSAVAAQEESGFVMLEE